MTQHGYVRVHVGKDHPLADRSGTAYAHRLVAANLLGGTMHPAITIHHDDGNRLNNAPPNLWCYDKGAHSRHHAAKLKRDARGRWLRA